MVILVEVRSALVEIFWCALFLAAMARLESDASIGRWSSQVQISSRVLGDEFYLEVITWLSLPLSQGPTALNIPIMFRNFCRDTPVWVPPLGHLQILGS